jgi:hypothetical protein
MTVCESLETDLNIPHDHPQRMLIVAYMRLFLLPERADGSKLTTVASFGAYDIRLIEISTGRTTEMVLPLWLELHDRLSHRVIDSAGCKDLQDAGMAVEEFIAEALRRLCH